MSALHGGDFSQAESILKVLQLRHPHSFQIDESLGLVYASQNRPQAALPLLIAAVKEEPKVDVGHANLGAAYVKLGRTSEGASELRIATQLNPENFQSQEALGQALMILHLPQQAVMAFSAALARDGQNPDLQYNAALAYFQLENSVQAEALLARMSEVENSAEAQSLYGDVEEKLGHYKEAAQHYARAAELAPTEANVYALGVDFLRHWSFASAAKEFEAGAKEFPGSRRIQFGRGVAYYGDEKYSQAIDVFADLLRADPDNGTDAELMGRTCAVLSEGNNPKCDAVLLFAEKHPQKAMPWTYAAIRLFHLPPQPDQLELAHHLLREAIRADPSLPEPHYEMGLLLQMQTQWPQSIPELKAAIRIKPDYSQAHYRLALAYSHIGRKEDANKEVALQQKYSKQENDDLDARMNQITTLLVTMK
jgi:tetratricopeptide (TPR) repeat protein